MVTKYYSADKIEKNEKYGHVACMGERDVLTGFWLGDPQEKTAWKNQA